MTFSDEFGNWKILEEVSMSLSEKSITINPSSIKLLRFTAITNWNEWEKQWLQRSYALCSFSYGISNKNKGNSFRYYPHQTPWINEFNLINTGNLQPLAIVVKAVQYNYYRRSYFYHPLPWTLRIEEYLNE